ncbi:MAG: hypothetical protein IS632_07750 [Thaumarchaeota archaeon]|nr:hypothetical protein [Nitrososphaerota archaeon]
MYVLPPDMAFPIVKGVEWTSNATTTDRALTWNVRFSEWVRMALAEIHANHASVANVTIPDLGVTSNTILVDVPGMMT